MTFNLAGLAPILLASFSFAEKITLDESWPVWVLPSEVREIPRKAAAELENKGWRFQRSPIFRGDFNRKSHKDLVLFGKNGRDGQGEVIVLWDGVGFIDGHGPKIARGHCHSRVSGIGPRDELKVIGQHHDGLQISNTEMMGIVNGKPKFSTWRGQYFCRHGEWVNEGDPL